ncbi:MAG: hypothetical protein E7174_00405 [Firmicutes bacterium]|nr:hypothetical protein [Bacillota bacterium]
MISLNLKNKFEALELDDKKDAISSELMFIGELLKKLEIYHGIQNDFKIKNYNLNSQMPENDFLTFIYDDIFEIQKQLLVILSNIQNQ